MRREKKKLKVSEKYETQMVEWEIKNKKIQNQLEELLKKTEKGDIEKKELLHKMMSYKIQIENSKDNVKIIQLKLELEKARMELSFKNEIAMREQREKDIVGKSLTIERESREELQKKRYSDILKLTKFVEENFKSKKAEVRDVVRKEVEENKSWFSRGISWLKSWFT